MGEISEGPQLRASLFIGSLQTGLYGMRDISDGPCLRACLSIGTVQTG